MKQHRGEGGIHHGKAVAFAGGRVCHRDARGGLHDAHALRLRAAFVVEGGGDAKAVEAGIDKPLDALIIAGHNGRQDEVELAGVWFQL